MILLKRLYGLLLIVLGLSLPAGAWAEGTNIYVCAHPDDCVLFMNPNLYDDIAHGMGKTVILYLTSGDAGEAFRNDIASYPYMREQASLTMTEWMASTGHDSPLPPHVSETVRINGHRVKRVRYANVVSYFLRLPDGNMYGEGFALYGHQSLQKLKNDEIPAMSAIDDKTSYKGWLDLVATLSAVIDKESGNERMAALHLPDTDAAANSGDHSDHQHGAQAVMQALGADTRCYRLYKHLDYVIATLPPNLDASSLKNKIASFAALTAIQQRLTGFHHWNEAHEHYLMQNYYTETAFPDSSLCAASR